MSDSSVSNIMFKFDESINLRPENFSANFEKVKDEKICIEKRIESLKQSIADLSSKIEAEEPSLSKSKKLGLYKGEKYKNLATKIQQERELLDTLKNDLKTQEGLLSTQNKIYKQLIVESNVKRRDAHQLQLEKGETVALSFGAIAKKAIDQAIKLYWDKLSDTSKKHNFHWEDIRNKELKSDKSKVFGRLEELIKKLEKLYEEHRVITFQEFKCLLEEQFPGEDLMISSICRPINQGLTTPKVNLKNDFKAELQASTNEIDKISTASAVPVIRIKNCVVSKAIAKQDNFYGIEIDNRRIVVKDGEIIISFQDRTFRLKENQCVIQGDKIFPIGSKHIMCDQCVISKDSVTLCDGSGLGEGVRLTALRAAQMASNYVSKQRSQADTLNEATLLVMRAINEADDFIRKDPALKNNNEDGKHDGYGTTLTHVSVFTGGDNTKYAVVASLGDSIAYKISPDDVKVISGLNFYKPIIDVQHSGGCLDSGTQFSSEFMGLTVQIVKLNPGDIIMVASDSVPDNFEPATMSIYLAKIKGIDTSNNDGVWQDFNLQHRLDNEKVMIDLMKKYSQLSLEGTQVDIEKFDHQIRSHILKATEEIAIAEILLAAGFVDINLNYTYKPDHSVRCYLQV